MNDKISVIIPVYNTGVFLKDCVKSVLCQDYSNIEIIIVDDGSNDELSITLCDEFAQQYPNVNVIHKTNGGSASARNFGIRQARGKYIGFVDSDDIIDEQMYSSLYSMIKNDNVSVAICGLSTEENERVSLNDERLASGCYDHKNLMHYFLLGHWHSACTCLYEKALFEKVSFPEGEVNEDYILNYHIFKHLHKISFINKAFYHYIRREGSNTASPKTLRFLDWIKHTQLVLQEMSQYPSLKQEAEYQYLYSNIILGNSALLTINRVKSEEAEKLYEIVSTNLNSTKKMLHCNHYFSIRNKLMGLSMAYMPIIYKYSVLSLLRIKKNL